MISVFILATVLAFPACVLLSKRREQKRKREQFAAALESRRAERDFRQQIEVWVEVRSRG